MESGVRSDALGCHCEERSDVAISMVNGLCADDCWNGIKNPENLCSPETGIYFFNLWASRPQRAK